MLAQAPHIGLSTVFPSRSALEDGSELSKITTVTPYKLLGQLSDILNLK